mmetsp:Transcript_25810/g.103101  ORF Transcript_25810/g.103101 Transcript_25810/m.103101 type:complete len:267 (-) Transcript_25810:139-939(-)
MRSRSFSKTIDSTTAKRTETTPLPKGLVLSIADCPKAGSDEQKAMQLLPYREIVGSCLYFSIITRPDFAFEIGMLARFSSNPARVHWTALMHLLRYLNGTADIGLVLGRNGGHGLVGIVDATWASDPDDRHSTSGYGFAFCGSLFAWWSRTQHILARSSFEAELVAIYAATAELAWVRHLLADFGVEAGTVLFGCDNQTTIDQLNEHSITRRTRHIDIRFYSTSECILNKLIELTYIPSAENPADMLTKSLAAELLVRHRRKYMTR